jgi:hypothetical protein
VEKYGRARQTTDNSITWRMRFALLTPEPKGTHSEYVILIAFPRQQWLRERASMLRYTYVACVVILIRHISIRPSFLKLQQTLHDL